MNNSISGAGKTRVNIFDKVFYESDGSMIVGRDSGNIDYVTDGSGQVNLFSHSTIVDFIENQIYDNGLPNYGVMFESYPIYSRLYDWMFVNTELLKTRFKKIFTYHPHLLMLDPELYSYIPAYCSYEERGWVKPTDWEAVTAIKKDIPVSIIVSGKVMSKMHLIRNKIAKDLIALNDPRVVVAGRGVSQELKTAQEIVARSQFHVVVENDVLDNYFTEKVLHCFEHGTVPIYIGAPNIDRIFNRDGLVIPRGEYPTHTDVVKNIIDYFPHLDGIFWMEEIYEARQSNFFTAQRYNQSLENFLVF
jgi:hypothetical protein